MLRRFGCLLAVLLPMGLSAETWTLSGKVVDAEEGNGLKGVVVKLAVSGATATTEKNGNWNIGATGIADRGVARGSELDNFLTIRDGRLALRLGDADIMGRQFPLALGAASRVFAAREAAVALDTLVFTKDNYVQKRVPLSSMSRLAATDTIRRIRYEGWVDSSHANRKADTLNGFTKAFRTMTFKWSKDNWNRMMKAMTDSCGKFGTKGSGFGGGTSKNCQDGQYDLIEKTALIWVPVDLEADGQVWKNVAIRLKGNASLQTAWSGGNYALPFRINTDKLEDSFPTAKDQRFYGFQKVSFYNSQQDSTSIRGPVAGEIFRQAGIPAPLSVPVKITLKFGDTTKEVGLYEMVEVPDEPFLTRNFQNDSGNLYKPLSKLDKFVDSEWVDEDIPGDRSDAKALINAINATNRTTDSAAWHRTMEKAIDVQGFLRWLAASTAIMNWDAYGSLSHNYYLFNDSGTFKFITYDFGWSFDYQMATSGIVSRTSIWYEGQAGGMMNLGPFPLVKNLLADKNYCESYRKYMTDVIAGPASVASFQAKVDKYAGWVANASPKASAIQNLRGFMGGRVTEIQTSLGAKSCPIPLK